MINALCVCITLIVILGVALFFHTVVKVTPEEGFASAVMTELLIVYITGLFGNTFPAVVTILFLSLIGIICGIYRQFRKYEYRITTFITPGIVMVAGISIFGLIAFHGMQICNWDELYQWGKAANYMVLHDKLPRGADFSGEAVLLSSTTFSHYIMAKLSYIIKGTITESNYYVSNLFLWFGALMLPFSGDGWKRAGELFGFGLFHFLVTAMIFVQPYYNIYTDQATAYWSGALIAWTLQKKMTRKNIYLIPLILINVGLMKSMVGPLFAVVVIISIALIIYKNQKMQNKKIFLREWKKLLFSKKGAVAFFAVLSPFLLMGIWSVLTGNNGIFRSNGGIVNPGEENRLSLTIKSMLLWIFKAVNLKNDTLHLSYGFFFLLTIGIVFLLYPVLLEKAECSCYQFLMKFYIFGFIIYFAIMLFAYMKVFSYLDSTQAISLNRYYSDYMMLGIVPLTLPFFVSRRDNAPKSQKMVKLGFIFASCLFILVGSRSYILPQMAHAFAVNTKKYAEREALEEKTEKVKALTNETGKIYFINQKKSGLFTLVADYELGDQLSRGGMCYKFREDTSRQISGLTDYSIYTLPEILGVQGYEYLWVYSSDEYLQDKMSALFGVKAKKGSFYKVVQTDTGVQLEYMKKIK